MNGHASPVVSVVIPSRNYAHYLGSAIDSALGQGYRPVDVIVVDDGSTDETPEVLARFDGHIRTMRLEGVGVSAARNAGLARARGEYVVFLDADDVLVPGGMAAQVELLAQHGDVDAVAGSWFAWDVRLASCLLCHGRLRPGDTLPGMLEGNIMATPSAMMLRREVVEMVGGFDPRLSFAADWDLWIRLALRGHRLHRITTPVAVYRIHEGSMRCDPDRAGRDVKFVLDRCFGDPTLPAEARARELQARFKMLRYVATLHLERGDLEGGKALMAEALRYRPEAGGTLELYDTMANAIAERVRLEPGTDTATALSAICALAGELERDPRGARRRRQALRHLAAGMAARKTGAWGLGLRHTAVALRSSWRTVVARPHLGYATRILFPPALGRRARTWLTHLGLCESPHAPPPASLTDLLARAAAGDGARKPPGAWSSERADRG